MAEEERAKLWRRTSVGNLESSKLLFEASQYRASVTRSYYAAYQATTAVCLEHGDSVHFPAGWNNPTHDQLPDLIRNNGELELSRRRRISQTLRALRRAREDADYRPGHTIDQSVARDSLHGATMILELLEAL